MSKLDSKAPNLSESFDNIPAIDDDEQSEIKITFKTYSFFFIEKSIF